MNIQYSKKKQELRKDPFMEFLQSAKEFATAKNKEFTGGAIVLALVVGVALVYGSMQKSSLRKAQEAFGTAMIAYTAHDDRKAIDALTAVSQEHHGSPQAEYSAYLLGTIMLRQNRYDEAMKWFEAAGASKKGGSLVAAGALEGLGTCYEGKGDLEKASHYFEQALSSDQLKHRRSALLWKLALIDNQLKKSDKAEEVCKQIVSDTLSGLYKEKAENLLTELQVQRSTTTSQGGSR